MMGVFKSFSELKGLKKNIVAAKKAAEKEAEKLFKKEPEPKAAEAEDRLLPPVNAGASNQSEMVKKDKEMMAHLGKILLLIDSKPKVAADLLNSLRRRWPKKQALVLHKAYNYLSKYAEKRTHNKAKAYIEETALFIQGRLDKNYGLGIEKFMQAVDLPLEGKPVTVTSSVLAVFEEIPNLSDLAKLKATLIEGNLFNIEKATLLGVPNSWGADRTDRHLSQFVGAVYKHLPIKRKIGSYVWYLVTKRSYNISHLIFAEALSSKISPDLLEKVYGTSELNYQIHAQIEHTRRKLLQEKQRIARLTFGASNQEKYKIIDKLSDEIEDLAATKKELVLKFQAKHAYKPSQLSSYDSIHRVADADYAVRVAGVREQKLRDELKNRCFIEAKQAYKEALEISKLASNIATRKALKLSIQKTLEIERQQANGET